MRGIAATALIVVLASVACQQAPAPPPAPSPEEVQQALVERGKYLVTMGGCHDCHTPKVMTERGPEPDMSRMLSGHPANAPVAPVPEGVLSPTGWMGLVNGHLTAWVGPWGVSFTANLTPDEATGLGSWTQEMFMQALRTGKHQGTGRDILPPMPWPMYGQGTDEDLGAIWAYLRSIPPVANAVPQPIPPPALPAS